MTQSPSWLFFKFYKLVITRGQKQSLVHNTDTVFSAAGSSIGAGQWRPVVAGNATNRSLTNSYIHTNRNRIVRQVETGKEFTANDHLYALKMINTAGGGGGGVVAQD